MNGMVTDNACFLGAHPPPHVAKPHYEIIAATVTTVSAQKPTQRPRGTSFPQVVGMLGIRYPAATELLAEAETDATADADFPSPTGARSPLTPGTVAAICQGDSLDFGRERR